MFGYALFDVSGSVRKLEWVTLMCDKGRAIFFGTLSRFVTDV